MIELDPRTFKCEETYQRLSSQEKLSDDEKELFKKLHLCRRIKMDISYPSESPYYDWDGQPIDLWEWSFRIEFLKKHVGDEIINGKRISTVWLGLDHGFGSTLLIFETMIFGEFDGVAEDYMMRYKTYDEALEGHQRTCELVRKGKGFEEE